MSVRLGIFGAGGRMGRMLIKTATETAGLQVVGAAERRGSSSVGLDAGTLAGLAALDVAVSDEPKAALSGDVAIDFTLPEATLEHVRLAVETGTAMVIGTTGLNAEQDAELIEAAKRIPIVYAPNMSVGVNLLLALVEKVAAALGPDAWDIEVVEMHHNRKVDAPSGTALGLGRAAAAGRQRPFDEVAVLSREGHTGARTPGEIGFATLRGGTVVGDHTVIFAGEDERIEITHKAASREIFSAGAIRAATWVAGKPAGLYGMPDVLGL